MDLSRFGAAPPWSLGVEEELMLVDAETLEPARDGFSRVFGEANERIKPELFESFVEITTTVVETPEEAEAELRALRHEAAERAAAHGLAVLATGSHPTARGRVPLVPVERYRAPEGEARAAALPAARLRPPRARVRPRPGYLPAGVRGRLAPPAGPPRRLCELAVLGRRGERSALDPLPDPARDADRRDASATAEPGTTGRPRPAATARAAIGTSGRGRSTGRSKCACSTSRRRCGGRPSSPPRCSGSSGRPRSSTGDRSTATSTRRCATPPGATAAGRRPSASSSSGREAAVREIAALTLG